jgi:hypothetical protein
MKIRKNEPSFRETFGVTGPVQKLDQQLFKCQLKSGYMVQGEPTNYIGMERNVILNFNEEGRLISEEHAYYKDQTIKTFFDEKGNEVERREYEGGMLKSKNKSIYSETGKILEISHFDPDDNYTSGALWEYDESGNNKIFKTLDKNKNITETFYMKYDSNGYKIEDKRLKPDGTITFWITQKNDHHGHSIETIYLNPDGTVKKKEIKNYIYDSNGECIGSDGRLYSKDAEQDFKDYENDIHGNWITRIGFYRNFPASMIRRNFTYFGRESETTEDSKVADTVKKIPYVSEKAAKRRKHTEGNYAYGGSKPEFQDKQITTDQAQWLSEAATFDQFPAIRYYSIKNNDLPSTVYYFGRDIEAIYLLEELRNELNAYVIFSYCQDDDDFGVDKMIRYVIGFPDPGYILQASQITSRSHSEYKLPPFIDTFDDFFNSYMRISPLVLYHPGDSSGRRNPEFEEQINNLIDYCTLEKVPDKPEVSMVEVTHDNKFRLSTYSVYDSFNISNLDMHYGYGFSKFHEELMDRFKSETRGLILFHGNPGTGKTYYIRHLLRKMTAFNKVVIYMPPNMVDKLVDPVFITFLSKEIARFSKQGFFCVLLIEDAEPLLASRIGDGRVQGISNLLNMTDGLLNDMFKLQIICTFNVRVKELDKALLRPGRLIARKEFRAMSVLDANRLARQLGIKYTFTKPATLAEVYSLVENKNTLIHAEGEKDED